MLSTLCRHMSTHSVSDSCKLTPLHTKWHRPVWGTHTYVDMQSVSSWFWHDAWICRHTFDNMMFKWWCEYRYMFTHMFDIHQHIQIYGSICNRVDMMSTRCRHISTHSMTDSCKLTPLHTKYHRPVWGVQTYVDMQSVSSWCWHDV